MDSHSRFPIEFVEAFRSLRTVDEVVAHYRHHLRPFGVESVLVSGLPASDDRLWRRTILCDDWPQGWYDRYVAEGHYRFDPCVQQCRKTYEPFLWSELPKDMLNPRQQRVLDEASEFGMRDGLCVPIHRPLDYPAVITMAGQELHLEPAERLYVQVLAWHMHLALSKITIPRHAPPSLRLTPREIEIVRYAADGKSAEDMATIMGITRSTVERHLSNIRSKLDCCNTTHAVAKALRMHQID